MRVNHSSFSITSVIFQYQSCDIQAYTRKDIFTWYFLIGYLDSEAFQHLIYKSFYRKQIQGKSCGEAGFDIESKGTAKQKGWTSNSIAIALKFSGSTLTTETAFWPIRIQLSVWDNRCKKSIYEPKPFYILKKKEEKKGGLPSPLHPPLYIIQKPFCMIYGRNISVSCCWDHQSNRERCWVHTSK